MSWARAASVALLAFGRGAMPDDIGSFARPYTRPVPRPPPLPSLWPWVLLRFCAEGLLRAATRVVLPRHARSPRVQGHGWRTLAVRLGSLA